MHSPASSSRPAISLSKTISLGALSATLVMLAACASVPPSTTLAPLKSEDLASQQSLKGEAGQWPANSWWQGFNDPQLNGLMDEALAHSPDLLAAQARLDKANATNAQVKAAMQPDASLNLSSSETKQSYNTGFPAAFSSFLPQGYWNSTRLSIDANYDLDVWGKSRAALKGSIGQARATQLEGVVVRQNLAVALTSAYVELNRLYDERDAIAEIKHGADVQLELMQARAAHQLDPQTSVLQAQDDQARLGSRLISVDSAIRLQQNLIAALVGAGPDRGLSLSRPHLAPVQIDSLPDDVHLNLLGRRPDVQAARLRVEAMDQQIKYNRADFYPNVKLNAYFGLQALSKGGLQKLAADGSDIGGIGPAISLPLFHQNRLNAAYRSSEADYNSAVAAYDKALVDALHQTSDASISVQTTRSQSEAAQNRLSIAQKNYELTKARFDKGMATKMDVLASHVTLVSAELDVADLKAQAYNDRIKFIAALGGGFQSE